MRTYRDVEIDTTPFREKRGREPSGAGTYVFEIGDEEFFCIDVYVRCKNKAAKHAAKKGVFRIVVNTWENQAE